MAVKTDFFIMDWLNDNDMSFAVDFSIKLLLWGLAGLQQDA
jgi:hypothetical protein